MYCIHCGKTISDTAKVCGYCGKRQEPAAATPASSARSIPKRKAPVWIWVLVGLGMVAAAIYLLGPRAPEPADSAGGNEVEPEFRLLPASQAGDVIADFPNIRDYAEPIDFNEVLMNGVPAVERDVYLDTAQPVRVGMSWCESDWETLYAAREKYVLRAAINGDPVEDRYWIEGEFENEGLTCVWDMFVITAWTQGFYLVEMEFVVTDSFYDSILDIEIPPGELSVRYSVTVE